MNEITARSSRSETITRPMTPQDHEPDEDSCFEDPLKPDNQQQNEVIHEHQNVAITKKQEKLLSPVSYTHLTLPTNREV